MQTTAIGTVANSLPQNEVILLTLLISSRYILFAELQNNFILLDQIDGRVWQVQWNIDKENRGIWQIY